MKSPAHRTRDIERQAGYLKPEHCAPPPPRSGSDTMWFIRDGCGIVCGVITWFLVFYAEFVVVFVMLLPAKNMAYSLFNGVIFSGLAFLALASHAKAMCTDPVSQVYIGIASVCCLATLSNPVKAPDKFWLVFILEVWKLFSWYTSSLVLFIYLNR